MPVKNSLILVFLFVWMFQGLRAQDPIVLPEHLAKTHIGRLAEGDSMIYYQCHVDEASQELTTSSGQKISTKAKKLTITERFAIRRKGNVYEMTYAVSGVNDFPNKKFAYLTLKEVANWNFEVKASGTLTYQDIILLSSFENKTHDITHYELKINKSCTNEVIIVDKKERVQLMVEGSYLLSKNMSFLLNK